MRVGVFSDIHGNDIALTAVLDALAQSEVDELLCLGDVAVLGPEPVAVIERLMALDCHFVMGNTDEWLLDRWEPLSGDANERRFVELTSWCREQLSKDHLAFLGSFRQTVELALGWGVRLLSYHGRPRSTIEGITAAMSDADVASSLDGTTATLCIGGHTHQQMGRRVGGQWVLNAGSVGLTFRQTIVDGPTLQPPWAEFAVVLVTEGSIDVSLRAIPLDIGQVIGVADKRSMPHREWWADIWTNQGAV